MQFMELIIFNTAFSHLIQMHSCYAAHQTFTVAEPIT